MTCVRALSAALLVMALSGCALQQMLPDVFHSTPAEPEGPVYTPPPATDITKHTYDAADALIEQLRPTLPPTTSMIAATLVNINALDESSPLGRLMGEQVAGRFVQAGYQVIEVKLRNQLYMKRGEGELMLTRELRDIAKKHNASVVLVGTYTDSARKVFVNLKAIRLDNNVVVGAVDFSLDRDAQVRSLLMPTR